MCRPYIDTNKRFQLLLEDDETLASDSAGEIHTWMEIIFFPFLLFHALLTYTEVALPIWRKI